MPASHGTHPLKIAAVLFDMDGTLVDSDAAVDRAWITWSEQYGVDPAVPLAIAPGHPADATIAKILTDADPAAITEAAARQLALQYDDLADVVAIDGAHELIAFLDERALPWAVVTSADQRLAKLRLAAAGISPGILITTDDIEAGKPDPAGYLRAAELLGVAPEHCLVVEDAEPGVAAGRAAGATVAALKGVPGDIQIDGLRRVIELIAELIGESVTESVTEPQA
ncbi:HAD family hydrolase [Catenulispora pinisilvae]|uniref:HAD family hydrolase n=1 Tax=Catenulispora pinisilvae TaxID=2705253 RepID=UPI0018910749|nr:HAD-IA family hydrolase [Catenulispora pinisilvae]